MLSTDFPGVTELRAQIRAARVRPIVEYPESQASLEFLVPGDVPSAPTRVRIPTEASYKDADGVDVHLLLHVIDGMLTELEIYKDDGSAITVAPRAESLRIEPPPGA